MKISLLFLQTALDLQHYPSFKAAADDEGIGPAAISYRLKRVEEWVGAGQLYTRRRGNPGLQALPNIRPTAAGKAFFAGMDKGLEYIKVARRDARHAAGIRRTKKAAA